MTELLIVADDLTGAADAASLFAQRGFATVVALRGDIALPADVISHSTNSRDVSRDIAIERVEYAVRQLIHTATGTFSGLIYKKMDSALRGHAGAELMATMRAIGVSSAVVAPALPDAGRTTTGGHQLVNGIPLEQSSFAGPGVSSDLVALIANEAVEIPVQLVEREQLRSGNLDIAAARPGIVVFDAETDGDLDRIAVAALGAGYRLLSGSAGLARAVERTAGLHPAHVPPPLMLHPERPILIVAGTRHEAGARQIAHAGSRGVTVVRLPQSFIDDPAVDMSPIAVDLERRLGQGNHVILTTSGLAPSPLDAETVAARLASIFDFPGVRSAIGGLVMTGGDIAAAVCSAVGADAIWLRGEVEPAIPWGSLEGGSLSGLPVVTKAGSFGTPGTLLSCLELLVSLRTN